MIVMTASFTSVVILIMIIITTTLHCCLLLLCLYCCIIISINALIMLLEHHLTSKRIYKLIGLCGCCAGEGTADRLGASALCNVPVSHPTPQQLQQQAVLALPQQAGQSAAPQPAQHPRLHAPPQQHGSNRE